MTTINAQIVTSGVVTNSIVVDSSAALSSGGTVLTFAGGSLTVPSGSVFMLQAGAGIGWTLVDGVLVAPSSPSPPTPTQAQLNAAAFSQVQTLLSNSRVYAVAGVTMPAGVSGISCDALASSADVQAINTWGSANPTSTQQWTDNAFNVFTLTGTQAVTFSDEVLAYGQSVYAELATVVTAIASGSITTLARVTSAAWPT
jgi:hypothetical protein